jgi:uncharacterized protein with NAD-binding domain and iron-sulfur cluster
MGKQRVVILGGGASGLAAAFGLTATKELREQYDITVYQAGWRAGGKCATGRAGPMHRIEQNGTHYLFGCYDNCFDIAKRSYDELALEGDFGFGRYEDAFLPRDLLVFKQFFRGRWTTWPIEFPTNTTEPGTHDGALPFHDYVSMALQLMVEAIGGWRFLQAVKPPGPFHLDENRPSILRALMTPVELVAGGAGHIGATLMRAAYRLSKKIVAGTRSEREALAAIRWLCAETRRWAWWLLGRFVDTNLDVNRALTLLDFSCTAIIGIIADKVYEPGGLGNIDRYEFREWLRLHGAREVTVYAPFVTTWYDAVAAYEDGDLSRPNLSAAVSLYAIGRAMLTYKGSFAYQMRSEIGDTFIGPIFQCLKNRGVRFNFFHRIWDIVPDDEGGIGEIAIERQVELKSGDPSSYDPFMMVRGQKAWPAHPRWEQIADADRVKGNDLDSFYTTWRGTMGTLSKGDDFDIVILALPVDCLRYYCGKIIDGSPAWQAMVANVCGVETQSIRLWFRPTLEEIGWNGGPPILSAYAPPFSTWEDNGQLVDVEEWPPAYTPHAMSTVFCALPAPEIPPGPEDAGYPKRQSRAAWKNAMRFMETNIGSLWPGATGPANPTGIDWDMLIDIKNRKGRKRLRSQYVRANSGPVERYTMARAGVTKYRLKAGESGYENLVLAGDWIRNGFTIGSVEGAMIGGLQASRAVCGVPVTIQSEESGLMDGVIGKE